MKERLQSSREEWKHLNRSPSNSVRLTRRNQIEGSSTQLRRITFRAIRDPGLSSKVARIWKPDHTEPGPQQSTTPAASPSPKAVPASARRAGRSYALRRLPSSPRACTTRPTGHRSRPRQAHAIAIANPSSPRSRTPRPDRATPRPTDQRLSRSAENRASTTSPVSDQDSRLQGVLVGVDRHTQKHEPLSMTERPIVLSAQDRAVLHPRYGT
jgi:hypothetical protein